MESLQNALQTTQDHREREMREALTENDKLKESLGDLKAKMSKLLSDNEALKAKVDDSVRQINNWKSMYENLREPGEGMMRGKRKQPGSSTTTWRTSSSADVALGRPSSRERPSSSSKNSRHTLGSIGGDIVRNWAKQNVNTGQDFKEVSRPGPPPSFLRSRNGHELADRPSSASQQRSTFFSVNHASDNTDTLRPPPSRRGRHDRLSFGGIRR